MFRAIGGSRLEDAAPQPKATRAEAWHHELEDRGCEDISDSCLECPLPVCIHDLDRVEAFRLRMRLKQGRR
jgi:hypothetical protein